MALVTVIALAALLGCASPAQQRADEIMAHMNAAIDRGATKDDVIEEWGAPIECTPIKDGEVCDWRRDPGMRWSPDSDLRLTYEDLRGTFDSGGKLRRFTTKVQQ